MGARLFVGGTEQVQRLQQALAGKPGLFGYETRLRRRDGRIIEVLVNLLNKPDAPGCFEGFVADLSERVQAQRRLRALNDELEQRVEARTLELMEAALHLQQQIGERRHVDKQLRIARDAAEEANRSKDKYLAAASHDPLQPLNAARLLISTLRERPLAEAEQQLVEGSRAGRAAVPLLGDPLPGRRLLVVGNKPSILHNMAALLGQWGCEALCAHDLAEARVPLAVRAPDVILADFHLDEEMLGCDLIAALRSDFGHPIPALIISADRGSEYRSRLQQKALPRLNKPLKPGKLRAALSQNPASAGSTQGQPQIGWRRTRPVGNGPGARTPAPAHLLLSHARQA